MNKKLLYILAMLFSLGVLSCSSSDSDDGAKEPEDPINTYFANEVKPQPSMECFNGAYYRKVVSSKDKWLGLGGTVTLPQITFDEDRKNPANPAQYLDNPSVYLGGNMGGQETDIGLTWEVIKDNSGNVSADRRAFRPFMRRTKHVSGEAALYANAPAEERYYWYPGDKVTISVQIVDDYKVKFIVDGEGKRFETDFDCAGYKKGNMGEFKRVNAIDQVSNEGKPAQATKTKVENGKWEETYLFRLHEGEVVKAPVHSGRFTDMRCPDVKYFSINASDSEKQKGAETIHINGAGF